MKVKKNLRSRPRRLHALFFILFFALAFHMASESLISPEWGYALELPEGYVLENSLGSTRYAFVNELYPINLQIALYPFTQFASSLDALTFVTEQLKSTGSTVAFEWRFRSAAIGQLEFPSNAGWAVSVELAEKKGWLVMASYAQKERATELESLIISTLDSVFTDHGSYFESGPMTSFAWGKEKPISSYFQTTKGKTEVFFDSLDAEANQSIVDREFQILTGYLDTPLVYEAWKRYYRSIYRDAWSRLAKPAFIIRNTLSDDPAKLAAELLAWTQTFTYERNLSGSDFINLPEAFMAKKADCDSRALLLVMLLNQMNIDAVLLVSGEYAHSVAAIDCPGEGARFTVGSKKYLIADTTSKEGLGKIAQDMADSSKWFAVTFYAFPQ